MINKLKYLLTFIVIGLGISFGFNSTYGVKIDNCNNLWGSNIPCYWFESGESEELPINNTNLVYSNFNFEYLSQTTYKALYITNENYNSKFTLFWNSGKLYDIIDTQPGGAGNTVRLNEILTVCKYNGTDLQGIVNECGLKQSPGGTDNCAGLGNDKYNMSVSNMITEIGTSSISENVVIPNYGNGAIVCNIFDNATYCIPIIQIAYCNQPNWLATEIESGQTTNGNGLIYYSSLFSDSPFVGGSNSFDDGGFSVTDTSLRSYLESRYGRNENYCYVGTSDLTSVWGTRGISFEFGTGATIFELYDSIYGTGTRSIAYNQNVGRWINSRMVNTDFYYNRNAGCVYNYVLSGDQLIQQYDCGEYYNVFENKPVAIYFMSDYLYANGVHEDGNLGFELASYCDIVLNGDEDFPGLPDDGFGSSLDDNYSDWVASNVGGSGFDYNYFNNLFNNGTGYNDWKLLSGDFNLSNMFNSLLGNRDSFFSEGDDNTSNPILPGYICVGLLLIVLFKFLRR